MVNATGKSAADQLFQEKHYSLISLKFNRRIFCRRANSAAKQAWRPLAAPSMMKEKECPCGPITCKFWSFFPLFAQFLDRELRLFTKKYIFLNKLNHERKPCKKIIKNTEKMSEKNKNPHWYNFLEKIKK